MKIKLCELRAVIRAVLVEWETQMMGDVTAQRPDDQPWLLRDRRDLNDKEVDAFNKAGYKANEAPGPDKRTRKIIYNTEHWAPGEGIFGLAPKTNATHSFSKHLEVWDSV